MSDFFAELPKIERGDDLADFTMAVQSRCDDASCDDKYVGTTWDPGPSGSLGAEYGTPEETRRRISGVAFGVQRAVCSHRANGGKGRGLARFAWTDKGFEGRWQFATSPKAVWDWLRLSTGETTVP